MRVAVASVALLLVVATSPLRALSHNDNLSMDAAGLAALEDRAEHAGAREQCFLYSELVEAYTDLAGHQLAAGDTEKAQETIKRVQSFAEKAQSLLGKDSKHLKDAEMIVHAASFRMSQFMRTLSADDKAVYEAAVKQLNKVHDQLLAEVFKH